MVDVKERMKGVDAELLLGKCQLFLPGKWQKIGVDEFEFKVIAVGFGNRLFICKIKDDETIPRVLIRLYGGNALPKDATIRTLNEVTETLLFYKLGELGYGPQLLGSFEGGRLEEFIFGSGLSMKDFATNANVSRALAKVMARYHRLSVPLSRKPWDVVDIAKNCYQKYQQDFPQFIGRHLEKGKDVGKFNVQRAMIEFDAEEMMEWITKVTKKIETRVVLTHNDANRSNIMIKGPSPDLDDENLDERLLLIDCEFSGYSHRGLDIGNTFGMRVFDFGPPELMSGFEYPKEAERRIFIESYVEDMKKSNFYEDWNENGIDSVDHILMETEFGAICARFINIVSCLRDLDGFHAFQTKHPQKDPYFGMHVFTNFVNERRQNFVEKYPQFSFSK